MAYYSVLAVTPTADDWIPGYLGAVGDIVARHGGRYLARTANHEQLEGAAADAGLRVILEWPSKDAAQAFMSDADYKPLLDARQHGSVSQHFLIEGKDDFA